MTVTASIVPNLTRADLLAWQWWNYLNENARRAYRRARARPADPHRRGVADARGLRVSAVPHVQAGHVVTPYYEDESVTLYLGDMRELLPGWRLSQDVVWDKGDGSCLSGDRFLRSHEHVWHWYRGPWRDVHHEQQRERHYGERKNTRRKSIAASTYGALGFAAYEDDGHRLTRRRAVLIEGHEPYCEVIARRLSQGDLFGTTA